MYWDGGPYDQDDTLMDLESLREKTTPSLLDWFLILSMTGLLLGVPFVLALLTAYFTPEVGISCRSFTFICYASAQLGQILLWLWAVSCVHTTLPESGSYIVECLGIIDRFFSMQALLEWLIKE